MPASSTTRRTSRGARLDLKPVPSETPKPEPEQKPATKIPPEIEIEAVPVTYYRPTVTFPGGEMVACQHKYLHEGEKGAQACGRKIAALGRFEK